MAFVQETTLSWLAALIDGEGSVMLNKRTGKATSSGRGVHYRPVVVIAANTDYRLMEAITSHMGGEGQIYRHRVGGDPRTPRKRSQWTYRLNVEQIERWLPAIRPWLVLKGEQSDLLLEAMDIKRQITPGQLGFLPANRGPLLERLDSVYAEIRILNTRGRTVENESG